MDEIVRLSMQAQEGDLIHLCCIIERETGKEITSYEVMTIPFPDENCIYLHKWDVIRAAKEFAYRRFKEECKYRPTWGRYIDKFIIGNDDYVRWYVDSVVIGVVENGEIKEL